MKAAQLLSPYFTDQAIPSSQILRLTQQAQSADSDSLFFCIPGARFDGHDFAHAAYARGCRIFIAQRPLELPDDATVLTVSDTRKALAHIARDFYGCPDQKIHLIGITGTKGKTTTAQLLAYILNHSSIPCGYIGTNGITYADKSVTTVNTTPDALTLQATLCDMYECGIKAAVIEVSSQALMQFRVEGIHFETVIFTNLSPDHIGKNEHPSFEHYRSCKARLFSDFTAKNAIFNADDPAFSKMLAATSATRRVACSMYSEGADYLATGVRLLRTDTSLGVAFEVTNDSGTHTCQLGLTGKFNAQNALLALATTKSVFQIPLPHAIEQIGKASVCGRSEIFPLPNGATAVIDYAHNGVSLANLLQTLREYAPQRLIALFGSVGGRTQMRRNELGAVAARLCDLAILTSDNPDGESPERIIADIAEAFAETKTPYLAIPDREEAIQKAVELTQNGDILVLAGKGHEQYQLINGKKIHFSEKDILKNIVNSYQNQS